MYVFYRLKWQTSHFHVKRTAYLTRPVSETPSVLNEPVRSICSSVLLMSTRLMRCSASAPAILWMSTTPPRPRLPTDESRLSALSTSDTSSSTSSHSTLMPSSFARLLAKPKFKRSPV